MLKALAAIAILGGLWAALFIWSNHTEAGRADYCLDEGGAWNSEHGRCEGARPSYKGP